MYSVLATVVTLCDTTKVHPYFFSPFTRCEGVESHITASVPCVFVRQCVLVYGTKDLKIVWSCIAVVR